MTITITWWMWVILALVWIITLHAVYAFGIRKLTKLVLKELSFSLDSYRKSSDYWMRINNRYLRDLANMTLSNDATLKQKHIKILAQNRKLRCSNRILARKCKIVSKALKEKPIRSALEEMQFVMERIIWAMNFEDKEKKKHDGKSL